MKQYFDKLNGITTNHDHTGSDVNNGPGACATGISDEDLWSRWSDNDEQQLCAVFRVSCTRKKTEHFPAHKFSSLEVQ
jgi:hypothetical protein